MLRGKFEKLMALISAELKVGILDQVVHSLLRNFAPLICSPNDGKADGAMKTKYELIPGSAVVPFGASTDQLLPRH